MFTAALFTITKTWKQPKCPSTEEWIKKMWYIYTMEYYSAIKKEWNNASCSNMAGPGDCHTEWSKSDRETHISYNTIYMWNLKRGYKRTYLQNRNRVTDAENKLMTPLSSTILSHFTSSVWKKIFKPQNLLSQFFYFLATFLLVFFCQ